MNRKGWIEYFELEAMSLSMPLSKQVLAIALLCATLTGQAQGSSEESSTDSASVIDSMTQNSIALYNQGQFEEATALLADALDLSAETYGAGHPNNFFAKYLMAESYTELQKHSVAQHLYQEIIDETYSHLGIDHFRMAPYVLRNDDTGLWFMQMLAASLVARDQTLGDRDQTQEVQDYIEKVTGYHRLFLGTEHPETMMMIAISADYLMKQRRFVEAQDQYEKIVAVREEDLGPEHQRTLAAKNNLARALMFGGELQDARKIFEELLETNRSILGPDHPTTLSSANNLAELLRELGEYYAARGLHEDVLARRVSTLGPDHPESLMASNNLAGIVFALGAYKEANTMFEDTAKKAAQLFGPTSNLAMTAEDNWVGALLALGAYDKALEVSEGSFAIRKEELGPHHGRTVTSMSNMASASSFRGDFSVASRLFDETVSHRVATYGSDDPITLRAIEDLSEMRLMQGDLSGARELIESRFTTTAQDLGPGSPKTIRLLTTLARVLKAQGDLSKAHELQMGAYLYYLSKTSANHPDSLKTKVEIADNFMRQGEYRIAREYFEAALSGLKSRLGPNHPATLEAMTGVAESLVIRQELDSAIDILRDVHSRYEHIFGATHPATLTSLNNLAGALRESGSASEALQLLAATVARFRDRTPVAGSAVTGSYPVFYQLGLAHLETSDIDNAKKYLDLAVGALEQQTTRADVTEEVRTIFRSNHSQVYNDTIRASLALGLEAEAFEILERYRGQGFKHELSQAIMDDHMQAEQRKVAARYDRNAVDMEYLTRLRPEPVAKLAELEDAQADLRRLLDIINSRKTRISTDSSQTSSLEEIRQALDPGTLLLSYSIGQSESFLFVLSKSGGLEAHRLRGAKSGKFLTSEIARKQVTDFILQIKEPGPADSPARLTMARWLYDRLLAPAAEMIGASERLLILPDGPLHFLPFAALVLDSEGEDRDDWQYLIEFKPLHYALSASTYAKMRGRKEADHRSYARELVAFGSPTYPGTECGNGTRAPMPITIRSALSRGLMKHLQCLPHSKNEVYSIKELYPKGSAQIYVGKEATEDRAKAALQEARILHFALHGVYDQLTPRDSFLAFSFPPAAGQAGGEASFENGALQAWEIAQSIRSNADLVVLSACQTAFGPDSGGDGLISLSRAFQVAGARSVVATLWAVEDESTALLMIRFYRHLRAGLTKDQALRRAQIELFRSQGTKGKLSSPYHWAAFKLTGDWH